MKSEMKPFGVVSEVLRPLPQFSGSSEKLTGSESVIDVPMNTSKIRALLRPRVSPLKASGLRRLAKAATRRVLRRVHREGPPENAEPYETTRCKGDNPGSCFVAVTAMHEFTGWSTSGSDAALRCDGNGL